MKCIVTFIHHFIFAFPDVASINSGFTPVSSSFPLSAISLMVSSSPFYDEAVNSMVVATNMVYREFLRSDEGQGFRGEVSTNNNRFIQLCNSCT